MNPIIKRTKKQVTGQSSIGIKGSVALISFGLLVVSLNSIRLGLDGAIGRFSLGLIVAGASLVIGALLGFLFGIPRTHEGDDGEGRTRGMRNDLPQYRANTNLEQISDWLTKALVGASLVSIGAISNKFVLWTEKLSLGFGADPHAWAFVSSTVLYHAITGFILAFLWTRIYLAGAFRMADLLALRREKATLAREMEALPDESGEGDDPSVTGGGEALPETRQRILHLKERIEELEGAGEPLDAQSYRRLARQLRDAGEYEAAEKAYLVAYDEDPTDPAPLNFAGVIRSKYMNDYDGAAKLYKRALVANPTYTSPVYNLACNEMRRGRQETALRLLSVAIAAEARYKDLAVQDSRSGQVFESLKEDPKFQRIIA